jgi:hypothetical protein
MATRIREIWKPIPGYEGKYSASNMGCVRSHTHKARILKPFPNGKTHHLAVALMHNGKKQTRFVHCLVLLVFRGPCPPGLECRHLDGTHNNSLCNLQYGTKQENYKDRIKHGTGNEGEKSPNAKLTWQLVRLIRSSRKSRRGLAKQFGVSHTVINDILSNKAWIERDGYTHS